MAKIYGNSEIWGDLLVTGSFSILGSASTINTSNLVVSDPIITLGHSQSGSPILDEGIMFVRGTGLTQAFIWDESEDTFALIGTNDDHTVIGNVNIDSYSNLRVGGLTASTLKITNGASSGYLLQSDASGNATWVSATSGSSNFANTNLTFTGNRTHDTNGHSFFLGTNGFLESYIFIEPTYTDFGFGSTYIEFFDSGIDMNCYGLNVLDVLTPGGSGSVTFNISGADLDFIVEGDTDQNLLFVDASTNSIGIGTNTPSYKLQVSGTISTTGLRMTNGASSGYLLQSDASGNATWVSATSASTNFANTDLIFTGDRDHRLDGFDLLITQDGTTLESHFQMDVLNSILGYNTNTFTADTTGLNLYTNYVSRLFVDTSSGFIGIGTTTPSYKLEVSGTVSTTGFRMTDGASNGYLLQSDASGNATWVSATSGSANFANTNLTFTGNRAHNTNGNSFQITTDNGGFGAGFIYFNNTLKAEYGFGTTYTDWNSTTVDHYLSGVKRLEILSSETVFNNSGGNYDFRIEGDTDANLFSINASRDNIAIGSSPGFMDSIPNTKFLVSKTTATSSNNQGFLVLVSGASYSYGINIGIGSSLSGNQGDIGIASSLTSTSANNNTYTYFGSNTGTGFNKYGIYSVVSGNGLSTTNYGTRVDVSGANLLNYGYSTNVSGTFSSTKYGFHGVLSGTDGSSTINYGVLLNIDNGFKNVGLSIGLGGNLSPSGDYGILNYVPPSYVSNQTTMYGEYISNGASITTKYGLYVDVYNATNNYGIVVARGSSIFNDFGNDYDFKINGLTQSNLFFVDASNDNIGIGTGTPDPKALIEMSSTTKGFLPPRMTTTQREAISSPPAGLLIFNTTTSKHEGYTGATWSAFY
jgi:hypothetical protein